MATTTQAFYLNSEYIGIGQELTTEQLNKIADNHPTLFQVITGAILDNHKSIEVEATEPIPDPVLTNELTLARQQYFKAFGEAPHHKKSLETILGEIQTKQSTNA